MTDVNIESAANGDPLMKAVAKAEVLTEDHEDAIEDLEDNQEEIGSWITIILKSLKEALL
ncbi:MAG: hypothetical protein HOO06_05195 [Bdellovibrionaceae bacterium]|jgi:hypothetical protein|nr:hypothetical protein [Pseudobdellovibrionaceae bacterium]